MIEKVEKFWETVKMVLLKLHFLFLMLKLTKIKPGGYYMESIISIDMNFNSFCFSFCGKTY